MIRLTSTDSVELFTPSGAWIIDPVSRTVDEQNGEEPRPFTPEEEALIPTPEQIAAFAAEDQASTVSPLEQASEDLRQAMFTHTDAIIDWCQDAQAYLYTAGASGAFNVQLFMTLLQQAEALLLQHKNLEYRSEGLNNQRDWMLQRGQQAQSILALAAVMG